jgi:hypothetical protein
MYAHDAECLDRVARTIECCEENGPCRFFVCWLTARFVLVVSGGSYQRRPRRP